jgi:hypothetical protein
LVHVAAVGRAARGAASPHRDQPGIINASADEERVMADRGREIEAFYWLILNLLGIAFGYLMLIGGGLFALTFALEKLRSGVVTIGGEVHAGSAMALRLIVLPALVALAGLWLARWLSARRAATRT